MPQTIQPGMKEVKNAIAVASGKGGVGKSTVATHLALALARQGAWVGLMDSDIYGPSVPKMLGGSETPRVSSEEGFIFPVERYGLKFISMGLFTGQETPVIWRGPMATKMVQQFLGQVAWGSLEYLIIDLPPGTGDVQLTLTQSAPLMGAVIVTTPQEVAIDVTLRGLRMFEQVQVPILGIVENMSTFVCSHCGESTPIFKSGGGRKAAERLGVPFLGEVPIDPALATAGDEGRPLVLDDAIAAVSPAARSFLDMAAKLVDRIRVVNEMTTSMAHHPQEVRVGDDIVEITWNDHHVSQYAFRDLRLACPCAMCVDELTGQSKINPAQILTKVRPLEVHRVGRYALQFSWSDLHSTGIYSYDKLRALDPTAPGSPGTPSASPGSAPAPGAG